MLLQSHQKAADGVDIRHVNRVGDRGRRDLGHDILIGHPVAADGECIGLTIVVAGEIAVVREMLDVLSEIDAIAARRVGAEMAIIEQVAEKCLDGACCRPLTG